SSARSVLRKEATSDLEITLETRRLKVGPVVPLRTIRDGRSEVVGVLEHDGIVEMLAVVADIEALDEVLARARGQTALRVALLVLGELRRVDDERVTFPMADRVPARRRCAALGVTAAVEIDDALGTHPIDVEFHLALADLDDT